MKTIRTIVTILALAAIVVSCEKDDEDQIHISAFEDQLHKAVNDYRDFRGTE